MNWTWFHKLASPPHAYRIAGRLAAVVRLAGRHPAGHSACMAGSSWPRRTTCRAMHSASSTCMRRVPGCRCPSTPRWPLRAAIGLVWRIKLAHAVAAAAAPIGASFTVLALATGAIWGKPTWGTWWVWDARLTSELILLFLYAGVMALRASIDDRDRADRASAVLAIVGVVNLPIIHYSVYWWNTLHQPSTLTKIAKPSMAGEMLWPLLVMLLAFTLFFGAVLLVRLRAEILLRERNASWLRTELAR